MSVANSYAKALYESAKESQKSPAFIDQIENQMDLVVSMLDHSREARIALFAPLTTTREKTALIESLAQKFNLTDLLKQFLILLAKKHRLSLLSQLREAFTTVRLNDEGGIAGRLVAAEPMNEADIKTLEKAFGQKLGKKVAFRVFTDSSLLAGMKVTVNGVTYDGTLRSQLQKLRDRFVVGLPDVHA